MKKLLLSSFALTTMLACAASGPVQYGARESGLAEELEGRVAGEPVACVEQRYLRGHEAVGDGLVLFEGRGDVDYLNHPRGGCPNLRYGRTLIFRTTSSRLCRGEIASVIEPVSGGSYGSCILGEFTPYREAD